MAMAEDLKFSAQPRLTLETSFLKIIEANNVIPVASLLSHLDTIISALPATPAPLKEASKPTPPAEQKKKFDSVIVKPISPANEVQAVIEQVATASPKRSLEAVTKPPQPAPRDTQSISQPKKIDDAQELRTLEPNPHVKDIRKDWLDFINYVKDRKVWMSQDLQRADTIKQDVKGELHLTYIDPANCSVLRQKENHQLLTEFALDFFQKPLKVRFILPEIDDTPDANGDESPHRKRQQLVNDPLVIMASEIFNGQIGDIRVGPRSR